MDDKGYRYTDKIQFLVMDLKAISDASEEERKRGLVEWAEAFTARDWEQLQKIDNPGVKEAAKQMQTAMSNQQQRQMIWSRKLAQMDHDTQLDSARKEGICKTLAELVKKKLLSVADAAEQAGVSESDFKKIAGIKTV